MELFLRVQRPGRDHADVRVDVDPDASAARLATGIADHLGDAGRGAAPRLLLTRTGEVLEPDRPIAETGIVSGDEVVLDPTAPVVPPPPTPIRAVSVDVLQGPDAGHSAPLDQGTFLLGRADACDIIVSDPTVSRSHLKVEVAADWTVTVTADPSAENGLVVNGEKVTAPRTVTGDDVVTIGGTALGFRPFTRASDSGIDRLGQVEFHRTPYRPEVVRERKLESLGPPPTEPERRRFQVFAILAPIGMGIGMFAMTGRPEMLMFVALSPVAMVGTWFEDRRSGRQKHVDAVKRYRTKIDERKGEIAAAMAEERVERMRSAPDLADLARRAELRTIDLWPRGRDAQDFLTVRLGIGDAPSRVVTEIEKQGDDELREELEAALDGHDEIAGVPIAVNLPEVGVLGVHGHPTDVDDVAASIALQVACLHSPEDLIVAAAVGPDRTFTDWLKWLPQARSATTPLAGPHLTTTTDGARSLLAELLEVAELRTAGQNRNEDRRWPWLFVILDGDIDPDASLVSQLLELESAAGISVLWICTSESRVPRQADAVLDCHRGRGQATLWRTDPEIAPQDVELGRVHADVADRVARSLAPVRDASVANATTAIPRTAPLLSVLGEEHPDAAWVVGRWLTNRPYGLEHPVGLSADGVFSLDLVADGPHALIGGTSGAGKSELLQSMVASLITVHPPTRLNFLFVDYKGGASSTVFRDVPHTVGYVTNLNEDLALRALTSLRAELNRRMAVMEGKAKDLEEMLTKFPDEAPASLVIMVDEFATLVKEIPDFVAGIVDIAQRGRSLGIHLVLATQRPSGSVNDNILANTNLRLSLRMLDKSESNAVIGSPEAADVPVPLRGRGYARLGPRELVAFQSAYASAPLVDTDDETPTSVDDFVVDPYATGAQRPRRRRADAGPSRDDEAPTQLDAVLKAVVDAAAQCQLPPARTPWREVLPDRVTIDELVEDPRAAVPPELAGRIVPIGLVDDPEHQDQYPISVDLEEGGGLLVFGSGGSGRTTLLRSLAATAALGAPPDELVVFGLDFASRALRSIEPLPHVAAVGTGDDLEAVTRIIALLANEIERRKGQLAELQAETLTAYRERGGRLPRVLLLIDGFPALVAAFSASGGSFGTSLDQWLEATNRVVLDGRQVGIHTVLTADRRAGVNSLLHAAVGNRLVLRQAEEGGYADHGVPMARAKGLDLPPGRGLWQAERLVQLTTVSREPDGAAQAAAIRALAERLAPGGARQAMHTAPLPELVELSPAQRRADGLTAVLGVADLTDEPLSIDLSYANALIAGLPRSGRSTAAMVLAAAFVAGGTEVWAIGTAASPLASLPGLTRSAFGKPEALAPVLDELCTILESLPGDRPRVLVVDDLDALEDATLNGYWERILRSDLVRVVATIENRSMAGFSMDPMLNEVRKARRALYLQPDDPMELFQATGVRPPIRPGTPMPPGRGVLVVDRRPTLIQVAVPGHRAAPAATQPGGARTDRPAPGVD